MSYNPKIRIVKNGGGTLRLSDHDPEERLRLLSRALLLHHQRSALLDTDDDEAGIGDEYLLDLAASGLFGVRQLGRITHTSHHEIRSMTSDVEGMAPHGRGGRLEPESLESLAKAAQAQVEHGSYDIAMVARAVRSGTSKSVVAGILGVHPSSVTGMITRANRQKEEEDGRTDRGDGLGAAFEDRPVGTEGGGEEEQDVTGVHEQPGRPTRTEYPEGVVPDPTRDQFADFVLHITDDDLLAAGTGDQTGRGEYDDEDLDDGELDRLAPYLVGDVDALDFSEDEDGSPAVGDEPASWLNDLFGRGDAGGHHEAAPESAQAAESGTEHEGAGIHQPGEGEARDPGGARRAAAGVLA